MIVHEHTVVGMAGQTRDQRPHRRDQEVLIPHLYPMAREVKQPHRLWAGILKCLAEVPDPAPHAPLANVDMLERDDVVTTKSGKQTYGLDRFFSSLYGKQVPGLCFLCLSLISVKRRTSYPVLMEQHDETLKEKAPEEPKKKSTTTRGRPKGSKNQNRRDVELSP